MSNYNYTIRKCRSCGKPYRLYSMQFVEGDCSLCSACRKDAEKQADMSREEWERTYGAIRGKGVL